MSTNAKPNFKLRKILFASVIALICVTLVYFVYQQNKAWAVPEEVKKLKETLERGLTEEQVAQFVNKIEQTIGTSINQAAFAQATGAGSSN